MYQLVKNDKEDHYFTGKKDDALDDESRSTLLKKIEKEINSSDKINKPPNFRLKGIEPLSVEIDSEM